MKKGSKEKASARRTTPIPESDTATKRLRDGEHTLELLSTTLSELALPGGGMHRDVSVLVGKTLQSGQEIRYSRVFCLNSAATVAEMRRFFALFDYPVANEGDLAEACRRARHGTLRVRLSSRDGDEQALEFLERMPDEIDVPDWADASDIWNHVLHWDLRRQAAAQRIVTERL